ncbi:hypothetical protein MPH_02952, partial [Macrophomina phaseolina MS6]
WMFITARRALLTSSRSPKLCLI